MDYMLSDKLIELLQFRINREEFSSRLYRAMSEWLSFNGYHGAAKLWKKYSEEELKHAEWAYSFLSDLDILPDVRAIANPKTNFTSLKAILDASYEHEMVVTGECNDLLRESIKEGCGTVMQLALKYQAEQVEELGKITYWLDRIDAFGEDKATLRLLDNEMGA